MSEEASPKGEGNVIRFPLPDASAEHPAVGATDERSPPGRDPRTVGRRSGAIGGRHPAELQPRDWDGAVGDHYAVGPRDNGYAVWLLDQPDEPVLWFPPHRQLGAFLAFQDLESQEQRWFRRSRSYLGRRPLLVVLAALVALLGATSGLQFALRDASVRSTHGDVTANGSAGDPPAGLPSPTLAGVRQHAAIHPKSTGFAKGRARYSLPYPHGSGRLGGGTALS